jgi:CRISPR/Cas system CSM-associated protein Csm2 small subunit
MDNENKLVEVINRSGLDTSQADNLMKSFAGFYSQAREVVENCKDIEVTDESQKDLMLSAKENRGKLRDIRIEADKTRIKLKEQSLREGRAIQGVYNVLEALIKPVEEHLEKQEKFAEVREQLRIEKRLNERVEKLSQYVTDVSLYSLKDMADEVFENLLSGCKSNFEKAQQEQKDAQEKELIEIDKRNTLRNRQNQLAPYLLFINQEIDLETSVDEFNKIYLKAIEDKKKYDKEQEDIRKQNAELQKKSDADRKAKEDAERKLQAEKDAQAKKDADEKSKIEADKKAQEEIERQKLLAPDKDKLLELANSLELFSYPAVQSRNAQIVIEQTETKLQEVIDYIREKAKTL